MMTPDSEQETRIETLAHGWVKVFRLVYDGLEEYVADIPEGQSRSLWAFDAARTIIQGVAIAEQHEPLAEDMANRIAGKLKP